MQPLQINTCPPMPGLSEETLQRSLAALDLGDEYGFNAIVAIRETALDEAREADKLAREGERLGPLHGWPIVVKDNIDVAGLPTTNGSSSRLQNYVQEDAEVVNRLRSAGAIIFAKTNMDELALGVTSSSSAFSPAINPWDGDRTPGGSSGGSAVAVAAGLACGALGTDTGGSARTPAAFNGVVGLRPTLGSIPSQGSVALSPAFDTIGPMGATVRIVRKMFDVMRSNARQSLNVNRARGPVLRAPVLQGLRVGICSQFFFETAEPSVVKLVEMAISQLRQSGAVVQEVDLGAARETQEHYSNIALRDAFDIHKTEIHSASSLIHPEISRRVLLGEGVSAGAYRESRREQKQWMSKVADSFKKVDILAIPTTPEVAPLRETLVEDSVQAALAVTRYTTPWSFAGVPALSIPCGVSGGMPVGLQLVGPWGAEHSLLSVGEAYESCTSWQDIRL